MYTAWSFTAHELAYVTRDAYRKWSLFTSKEVQISVCGKSSGFNAVTVEGTMALIYHDKLSVQDVRCLFCSSASLGCTTLGIQAIHHATPEPKVSDVTCNMDLLCVLLLIGNIGPLVVSHHNNQSQYREERWYAVLRWYAFC